MEAGDLVLFYRDQAFISRGRITLLLPDAESLANELWDPDPSTGSYQHVFFLDRIEETQIPWSLVRDHLEYSPDYYLQRLTVLDAATSESLLETISEFDPELSPTDEPDRDSVEEQAADASQEALESGQGFAGSAAVRKALEDHSMRRAEEFFQGLDFATHDVSARQPYDLRCEQGELTIHVEVKGTQTNGEQIILTRNEVEFAREHADRMVLFVLHSVDVTESDDGAATARGGKRVVHMPWKVDDGELMTINYRYSVPRK